MHQTRLEPRVQMTKPCFVIWTLFMGVALHGVECTVVVRLGVVEDKETRTMIWSVKKKKNQQGHLMNSDFELT